MKTPRRLLILLAWIVATAAAQASDMTDWAKKEDFLQLSVPVNSGKAVLTVGRNEIGLFAAPDWHKVAIRRYDFLGTPSVSPEGRLLAILTAKKEGGKAKVDTLVFDLSDLSVRASLPGLTPTLCMGGLVVLKGEGRPELEVWRVTGENPEHVKSVVVEGAVRLNEIQPAFYGLRLVVSADTLKPSPAKSPAAPVDEKCVDIFGSLPPPHWGKFVQIWDMQTLAFIGDKIGGAVGKDEAWKFLVSPDTSTVVVELGDGISNVRSIALVDADSGKVTGPRLSLASNGEILGVRLSEDGRELLAIDEDGNELKWPVGVQ